MARVWVSFDECKRRVRVREVMEVLGVDLSQYSDGPNGSLTGVCPLPGHPVGDPQHRNPRQFRVDRIADDDGAEMDVFKCFAGDHDVGGSVVEFAMQMLGRDAAHVRYFFADHWPDRVNGKPPSRKEREAAKKEPREEAEVAVEAPTQGRVDECNLAEDVDSDKQLAPMDHCLKLDPDVDYLKQRGVSPATIAKYGLGYASRGRMRGYVCMPIYMPDQPPGSFPVVYLGRRVRDDPNMPKYLWGASVPKNRILVGLPQALDGIGTRAIVVVEGIFDMFAVVDAGFPHVVSIVGAEVSDEQADILADLGRPVVLMFDGDEAGLAGGRKAAAKLITRTSVRAIKLPDGKDPDDLSTEQLRQHLSFLFVS